MEKTFIVPDMHCTHCVATVKGAAEKVPGVEKVDVTLETKEVKVVFDGATEAQIKDAIEETGFDVSSVK